MTRYPVATRYNDYDTKGHVNNAVFLTYFEGARERAWLEGVRGSPDFPFILAEATVRYVSEAKIGDPLAIEIETSEVRNKAWVWRYRLLDPRDDRLVAEGSTVQVMYDYEGGRTVDIPVEIRERLKDV
ncbi:MAG TPA: thioesterase family protein [Gemmatimonadaceae bacterium]